MPGTGPAGFNFYLILQPLLLNQMLENGMSKGTSADITGTYEHDAETFHKGSIQIKGSGNKQVLRSDKSHERFHTSG